MPIKTIRLLVLTVFFTLSPMQIVSANSGLQIGDLAFDSFTIKKNQPYDELKDMPMRTFNGGPTDESPQHGYFAVPLLVIGIAAVFVFFMKND